MPCGIEVYARWMSAYDPAYQTFVNGTPMAITPSPMTGHQFVKGTIGYSTSCCVQFGLTTVGNPTNDCVSLTHCRPGQPYGQLKTDAVTGKALCADVLCLAPAPGEKR